MNYTFNNYSFNYMDCIDYTKKEAIDRLIEMSIEKAMTCEAPAIQYVIIDIFNKNDDKDDADNFYYVHIHPSLISYHKCKNKEKTFLTNGMCYAGSETYALIKTDEEPNGYRVQKITKKMLDILDTIETGLRDGYIGVIRAIANNPANYGE